MCFLEGKRPNFKYHLDDITDELSNSA